MDFGDPTMYYCPSCNKIILETRYISYSFYTTDHFSDGSLRSYPYYPLLEPDLAKCPHCGALFFVHNLLNKEAKLDKYNTSMEDYSQYEYIKEPELDDYIKAVNQRLYKTRDEEIEARKRLWLSLNKIIRNDGSFSPDQLKLWQDNCAALLPLFEPTLSLLPSGSVKDINKNSGFIDEDDYIENLVTIIAELHRNLEHFDQCVETINKLPKRQWLKDQYVQQCQSRNRFIFELTPKPHDADDDEDDDKLIPLGI